MKTSLVVKNAFLALLGSLFILLNATHAKATHMLGADISWTCKGDTSCTITVTGYRDCNGVPLSSSPIYLVPQSCSGDSAKYFQGSLANGKDATPICNSSCDRCTNSSCSFAFGIQQWQETVTVHFTAISCCKYEIQWEQCCRSSSITTFNPDNFHLNAILDRCDTPCSSPYFSNPPLLIVPENQCFMLNQGAADLNVDARGNPDSLVYKLVEPLNTEGTPVAWYSPYNYQEPLKYSGAFGNINGKWDPANKTCDGFHFDSLTGDIYFKPVKQDITTIAMQVQAWKKDSSGKPFLASFITRDVCVSVTASTSNHIPTLTGINGTNQTNIDFCVGQYKCFKIISYDQDASDTVNLEWNNAIPGATFTANNKQVKHPIGTFCWKPTVARSYPYYFTVRAQDNACTVNGRASRTYSVRVYPQPTAVYFSHLTGACGEVIFKAIPDTGTNKSNIASYLWHDSLTYYNPGPISSSPGCTHKFRKWGTFPVYLTVATSSGCPATYTDSVTILKYVEVLLPVHDTTVYRGTTMYLSSSTILGKAPYHYSWNCNGDTTPYTKITITKDTVIKITVADSTGCTNYDSLVVHVPGTQAKFTNPVNNCLYKPVSFTDKSLSASPCGPINEWHWSFGDGGTDTVQNPSHTYTSTGSFIVKLIIYTYGYCADSTVNTITVDSICKTVKSAFFRPDTGCTYTAISFSDSSISGSCGAANTWAWNFGDSLSGSDTSSLQNPTHTYTAAGTYTISLKVTTTGGCTDSTARTIFIDSTCVWPGDVNNDKIADTNDVLYIGIAYNATGPKRLDTTTQWYGHFGHNWAKKFSNGANYKYADCNGDGLVNSMDMQAVNSNWGNTHSKNGQFKKGDPADPAISLQFSKAIYNPGDTVNADILAGSAATPLSNVYGLASGFIFNPKTMDTATLKVQFGNSWFGTPGKDMVSFVRTDFNNNAVIFAVTRIDHANTSGNGKIGAISFVIPQTADSIKIARFLANAGKAISFNESILPVYLPDDTFSIQVPTGISQVGNAGRGINIFPNPASSTLTIESAVNQIISVTVFDATGMEVYRNENLKTQNRTMPVGNFSTGMYIIKIGLENGTYVAKFLKE